MMRKQRRGLFAKVMSAVKLESDRICLHSVGAYLCTMLL
jgi:hypothetical protein